MSQINYKIIELLLRSENHIRGIAKELGTNQTTVARKVIELSKQNIVDFRTEGRNKTVFLKKTLEAKQAAYNAESEKLIDILQKYPALRRIINEIKNDEDIGMAILFGSYAKGLAKKDSDIDIYLDTKDKKIRDKVEQIDSKINVKIGAYNHESILIKEIERNHVIIKGIEEYYGKNKFFD